MSKKLSTWFMDGPNNSSGEKALVAIFGEHWYESTFKDNFYKNFVKQFKNHTALNCLPMNCSRFS